MSERDLAWLTGFYEGEGTCGFYTANSPTNRGYYPRRLGLSIGQNERAVLEKVRDMVGYGYIYDRKGRVHSVYSCAGTKAYQLLILMLPLMKSNYKRGQAQKAISAWEDYDGRSNAKRSQY